MASTTPGPFGGASTEEGPFGGGGGDTSTTLPSASPSAASAAASSPAVTAKSYLTFAVPSYFPGAVVVGFVAFMAAKLKMLILFGAIFGQANLSVSLKLLPMGIIFILAQKLGARAGAAASAPAKRYALFITAGLGLSAVGDLLLELEGHYKDRGDRGSAELCFLGGLASFLLGHASYIVAMSGGVAQWTAGPAVVCYAYAVSFVALLWAAIADPFLKAAVAVYAAALATMLYAALCRGGGAKLLQQQQQQGGGSPSSMSCSSGSARACIGGALLFVVSDSLLASDRFLSSAQERPFSVEVGIMGTYYAAQYFLAYSINGTSEGRAKKAPNKTGSQQQGVRIPVPMADQIAERNRRRGLARKRFFDLHNSTSKINWY